jgi:hypothetical protein
MNLDTQPEISYQPEGKTTDKVLTPEQMTAAIAALRDCCHHLFSIAQDMYHPTDTRIVACTQSMKKLEQLLP